MHYFNYEEQQVLLENLPPTPPASESEVADIVPSINDQKHPQFYMRQSRRPFFLANIFQPENAAPAQTVRKQDPSQREESTANFAKEVYDPRELWCNGSIVEVFSRSYDAWFTGSVEGIGFDEDGEFFEVHYTNHENGKNLIKYINRYDTHLRSIQNRTPVLKMPVDFKQRTNRRKTEVRAPKYDEYAGKQKPSVGPKRNSINKKPRSLNQKGLLPQSVIDELLEEKENFRTTRSCDYARLADIKMSEKANRVISSRERFKAQSSTCSENLHHTGRFIDVDLDNEGGDTLSDSEDEPSISHRHAWLDAEEFEHFFRCPLPAFLRRVQYFE